MLEALNEISIDRGCNPNIVKLNCYLEGKYFATFEGDGVLVATPTGSTATATGRPAPTSNGPYKRWVGSGEAHRSAG